MSQFSARPVFITKATAFLFTTGKTPGIPLFQEQAMKIAVVAAGFSPGEADGLRRSMATFRQKNIIGDYRKRFIEGMIKRGYSYNFSKQCFQQIALPLK